MHFSLSLRAARRLSLAALYMLTVLAMLLSAVGCSKVENPIHENNTSDATGPVETESSNVPQDNTPGFYNILNGESCSQEQAQIRPLAIMVNNIKASLPQVGLEKADIIYECEAEGTITRLLALFSHYADITDPIGSIRSSREYFIDFAANHDAIYIHAGGSTEAYSQLASRNIDHIDGLTSNAFYRDQNRRAMGMAIEHTLVSTGDRLARAIQDKGFRTELDTAYTAPFLFSHTEKVVPTEGVAQEISTKYSSFQYSAFQYDQASQKYLRTEFGTPHIDANTGNQLSFDNVIVLFCKYTYTGDAKNHIMVETVGSGEGYYCTGGKYQKIKWAKAGQDTPMVLNDSHGNQLIVNPGKTFITVMDTADATSGFSIQ